MSTSSASSLVPSPNEVDCLCIGSGRFLRSVLVPALNAAGHKPAVIQTRGRTFLDYCAAGAVGDANTSSDVPLKYEVDVVEYDGTVATQIVDCWGAGTLGTEEGRDEVTKLLDQMKSISIIGVGVTEAGLSGPTSQSLIHLAAILKKIATLLSNNSLTCPNPNGKVCVVNTDNVPGNGSVICKYLLEIAKSDDSVTSFEDFLRNRVTFHNTMVDRITSQRDGSGGMVPRCEPVPSKALVIEDLDADLPATFSSQELKSKYGVVVRAQSGQLDGDIALKLRVANGTHTAVAHVMALSSLLMTDALAKEKGDEKATTLMSYLDSYFLDQILVAASDQFGKKETESVYEDWRKRLCHPKFGLSTFFITQNGAAKGGIRIGPTIRDLIQSNETVAVTTAFAIAAILRFLTPAKPSRNAKNSIYRGWLDGHDRESVVVPSGSSDGETAVYADGLRYNLAEGWYEFRGSCNCGNKTRPICELLGAFGTTKQPIEYLAPIKAYLSKEDGGNLGDIIEEGGESANNFCICVATLYARMVAGDGILAILKELLGKDGSGFSADCKSLVDGISPTQLDGQVPLHYRQGAVPEGSNLLETSVGTKPEHIASIVNAEVGSVMAIDLHTHLLPPSHGALCSWGIDEILTYHYLIAEYFITAPAEVTPEQFYVMNKQDQADVIWKALFIERSPISEACRGVITTLVAFGLSKEVEARDLEGIRRFYIQFRDKGLSGTEEFSRMVYKLAGVKYAVMTNVPFDANEAAHWRPKRKVKNLCGALVCLFTSILIMDVTYCSFPFRSLFSFLVGISGPIPVRSPRGPLASRRPQND
mmetsp:Transcript_19320/g.55602  ORF Transcript_19320/g.55602 Transcript_19320/m.55602 type:complete len:817 (+) Transcript_19320:310-2760(+)